MDNSYTHVYIPNLVYKSLGVRCTVIFYNHKFRELDDVGSRCRLFLGVVCNIVTVEQITGMFRGIMHIIIRALKLARDISMVIKSILSDRTIENPS